MVAITSTLGLEAGFAHRLKIGFSCAFSED